MIDALVDYLVEHPEVFIIGWAILIGVVELYVWKVLNR